ncbi:MAG: TIGR02266 family protein [Deltaproteobacteria bacterium]|nr:MAG: TIGR02266 family protein [Deltaproteobacteria bacterium]
MSNTGTRQAKRTPVTLKIKFKSETLDQFIERYSVDVSHGGIFIRTRDPLPVGTTLKFEFQLKDASPLIRGEGTVVWTREHDPSRAGVAPGMGVRFDRLPPDSQAVLDQILTQKAAASGGRARRPSDGEKFGDAPTRVAPSPLVQDLQSAAAKDAPAGGARIMGLAPPAGGFGEGERTDATPLPTPMPFHSDADDFPDEAFEEKTRVASLDPKLLAQAARDEAGDDADPFSTPSDRVPAADVARAEVEQQRARAEAERKQAAEDELAKKREEKARAERERAAELEREAERRAKEKAEREQAEAKAKAEGAKAEGAKAEGAKAEGAKAEGAKAESRAATATVDTAPPARRSSGSIVALAVVAVAVLAVGGYVVLNSNSTGAGGATDTGRRATAGAATRPDAPAAGAPTAGAPVTGGPIVAGTTDRAGDQATPAVAPEVEVDAAPPAETVAVTLSVQPKGATVELVDDGQRGPTFPALEKGRTYRARVSLPGYAEQTIEFVAGEPPPKIALAPLPRALRVTTVPPGATVFVNGKKHPEPTPTVVPLTGGLARAKTLRISVRKAGYVAGKAIVRTDQVVWRPRDGSIEHELSIELQERPVVAADRGGAKPAGGGAKPDTGGGAKPAGGGAKPDTGGGAKPAGDGAKPDTGGAKPDTGDGAKPDTGDGAKPDTGDAKPDTGGGAKPDTGDKRPVDEGPKPDWMK